MPAVLCRRLFRVVGVIQFLDEFASDRSHMLAGPGTTNGHDSAGAFLVDPPAWPAIVCRSGRMMTLGEFTSMDPDQGPGRVMTRAELVDRFVAVPASDDGGR